MKIFIAFIIVIIANISFAEKFTPYYASIKFSEVNVRKGPNARYPISWVYKKKGEPLEIIAQFEQWYRIRDITGDEGWVKSIMFSKKRGGIIIQPNNKNKSKNNNKSFAKLYRKPDESSKVFASIESSKRVFIKQCKKQWCQIETNKIIGWIEKKYLWGTYTNEEFKK
jgi:SH3-like domain-containing protein